MSAWYKYLAIGISAYLLVSIGVGVLQSCSWTHQEDVEKDNAKVLAPERDPLPGELVAETIREDSLLTARKETARKNMKKILTDYQGHFKQEYFTGYYLTDFDDDGLPELWVKIGNHRDNARLELYTINEDGSLKKSIEVAEPGKYYRGDKYIIQAVGAGPGYININRLSIHNGALNVENIRELDMLKDPEARIPKFKEREISDYSLRNLTPLLNAFN